MDPVWLRNEGSSRHMMRNRDLIGSLFWIAFAVFFITGSVKAGLIRKGIPGPGFVPFLSAVVLISLALIIFIPALKRNQKEADGKAEKASLFPDRAGLKRVLVAPVVLFAYSFLLDYLGYLTTTVMFMLFSSRLVAPPKWRTNLIISVLTAVISYILFVVMLGIQLPAGLWGI